MTEIKLYPMKEIRIIIQGEHVEFVTELLDDVEVAGYTIISNLSGKGEHGIHTAHSMFNEMDSMQMVMSILPEEKLEPVLAGLKPVFHRYTGIMMVSDVSVSRPEHFIEKGKSKS